ncbi:MAG: glycerophosphodiester phosphodiesterase family protein, partial [Gemmatimonadota bacterium]
MLPSPPDHPRSRLVRPHALLPLLGLVLGAALPAQPLVIAHRGDSWRAPEHTIAAWRLALASGADVLEQDLQLTSDGRLLVLHDETGERTLRGADCGGAVRDRPLAHWQRCDAGRWFNERHPDRADPAYTTERLVALEAVLAAFPTARFYIETKAPESAPGMEDSLVAVLTRARLRTRDAVRLVRVRLQSFSEASLKRLRQLAPELPRIQ